MLVCFFSIYNFKVVTIPIFIVMLDFNKYFWDMEFSKFQIQKITREKILDLKKNDIHSFKRLNKQLDEISRLSSEEQKLNKALTSLTNVIENNHTIYCLLNENNVIIGILKIGPKNLYLYDTDEMHYLNCLCVLDFYVSSNFQRKGLGIKMFDFMLADNNVYPYELCYDSPSYKFQTFLRKYFGPLDLIKQPNKYVIFPEFFIKIHSKKNKKNIDDVQKI